MPINTRKATQKSTSPPATEDIGIINRGKYTFVIRLLLLTRLLLELVTPLAKSCHGKSAAYENMGYGTPSDGIFARLPKKIVKTTIVKRGCRIAHSTPKAVCL